MPGASDKILINNNSSKGNRRAVKTRYKTLRILGEELVDNNLLVEAEPIKEKMQKSCAAHDKADKKYINELDEVIADIAALIDSRVVVQP